MSFNKLKQATNDFDKLNEALQKMSSNKSYNDGGSSDERFWKPEVDKAGNGYAVIRFLPAPDGEDGRYARVPQGGCIHKQVPQLERLR